MNNEFSDFFHKKSGVYCNLFQLLNFRKKSKLCKLCTQSNEDGEQNLTNTSIF